MDPISQPFSSDPAQQPMQSPLPPSEEYPESSGKRTVSIVIGVLVLVGIIALSYYLGTKRSVQPTPSVIAKASPTPRSVITNAPIKDSTTNWQVYTDANVKFSIKYPLTWRQKITPGKISLYDPSLLKLQPQTSGTTLQIPTRFVDIYPVVDARTPKAYVDSVLLGPEYRGVDAQRKTVQLGSSSAELLLAKGAGWSGYLLVVSDGKGHIIDINIPTSFPSIDTQINQILSTFMLSR